ncbi:hypothetical protein [Psychroserpens algicola]|uniref:Polymer-forming cytoskeletal protein n=1 Tax=Psychroserpens algicola TaxID=1719034 RepID=A0ABT0H3Q7_9FLAO|nr:hypothetical protein [Psychroserpens algicola]MCK8479014.1 hypothetical protein [Psychroserpens algicola]
MIKKVTSSSLQLVTFIIVVIALLLSSFLILMHFHKQFRIQTSHVIETIRLSDRGIEYCLSKMVQSRDTLSVELNDEDYKSLKVEMAYWGVFEKVYSESRIKNKIFKKIALVGQKQEESKVALFLKDNGKPLVVVGSARIEGQSYLPKRGIKSGHINGHSFYGTTYVEGDIMLSKNFPKLNINKSNYIKSLFDSLIGNQNGIHLLDLNITKKMANSFMKPLLVAYSNQDISLSGIELSGHIIVQSNTRIVVDQTSKLHDVILIAPYIEIKSNVKGTFQGIATKNIIVSNNVKLDYPSALVLCFDNENLEANKQQFIDIRPNTVVKGSVLCLGETEGVNYDIQLRIQHNALVEGEVYCEGNLELRGKVYGSVCTNNFIVKERGTTYQNHLYNGEVNVKELTNQYVGIALDNTSKDIMKWLY